MDPIECKVWHGDTKLYKKLDKLCRNPAEMERFWSVTEGLDELNGSGVFGWTETPRDIAKYQMTNILEIIGSWKHCYWPAFAWLINNIRKHDSGLLYFQFVVSVRVSLLDKYDDIHVVKMYPKSIRSRRIINDYCNNFWIQGSLPEFLYMRDDMIFNKTRYCDSNNDQGTKGEIYVPYLLIVPQKKEK
jgi:hypothetical protein